MELSYRLMREATRFYKNTVAERPKQVKKGITAAFQCLKMHRKKKLAKSQIGS